MPISVLCNSEYTVRPLPVHRRVVHERSVTLQVKLAESQNSQCNEGDGEHQAQE